MNFTPVFSAAMGLGLGLVLVIGVGENPWSVLCILAKSSFGSRYDFGLMLAYFTPLLFTGLAVAVPLQCGLFNIGAEGQLTMGALAAASVGAYFTSGFGHRGWMASWVPDWLILVLAALAAILAGSLWGAIPGFLKVWKKSHEVIHSMMLNFIAMGVASWVVLYGIKNPNSQNPESFPIAESFRLQSFSFFQGAPVSFAMLSALALLVLYGWILWRTQIGFQFRAVGANSEAASLAGIPSKRAEFFSMLLGGGIAGMVGIHEVLGNAGKFRLGFSPEFGFMGIAVALLGQGKALGIFFAALLMAVLHKGSLDLDIETEKITRDLAVIFQALVVLSVSAEGVWKVIVKWCSKCR